MCPKRKERLAAIAWVITGTGNLNHNFFRMHFRSSQNVPTVISVLSLSSSPFWGKYAEHCSESQFQCLSIQEKGSGHLSVSTFCHHAPATPCPKAKGLPFSSNPPGLPPTNLPAASAQVAPPPCRCRCRGAQKRGSANWTGWPRAAKIKAPHTTHTNRNEEVPLLCDLKGNQTGGVPLKHARHTNIHVSSCLRLLCFGRNMCGLRSAFSHKLKAMFSVT